MISIPNLAGTGKDLACGRVIIKLGSNVVIGEDNRPDVPVIESLADDIAGLRQRKVDVIIVTSGAVGLGCSRLKRPRPKTIPDKQAMAAIGQIGLMHLYQGIFAERDLAAAQLLLTRADMEDRRRYLNTRHAIERLLELGAVPIINENDTISTEELSFGDNDMLSAYVAVKIKADLLVVLSTVAGVLSSPPRDGKGAKSAPTIIPVIKDLNTGVGDAVDDSRSKNGMGGMKSKLMAAKIAVDAGVHAVIAGGKTRGILGQIFTGSFPGTYLPSAREGSLSALERWIGFGRAGQGHRLVLDAGAVDALLDKKKSLLPVGVKEVVGRFHPGDSVDICDAQGTTIARGLVNYSSEEIEKIKGHKTAEIAEVLGYRNYDEIVHRDNLVILQDNRQA